MDAGVVAPPATAGAAAEDALRVQEFEGFPSPEHFSSSVEPSNVPAVFVGAVKDWEAFSRWDPRCGGLDYLMEQVGSTMVEGMLSRSAPIFYGDLRSHERVLVSLSSFIAACKLNPIVGNKGDPTGVEDAEATLVNTDQTSNDLIGAQEGSEFTPTITDQTCTSEMASEQVYLAQVPILTIENKGGSPLEDLGEDIKMLCYGHLQLVAFFTQCLYMERPQTIVQLTCKTLIFHFIHWLNTPWIIPKRSFFMLVMLFLFLKAGFTK